MASLSQSEKRPADPEIHRPWSPTRSEFERFLDGSRATMILILSCARRSTGRRSYGHVSEGIGSQTKRKLELLCGFFQYQPPGYSPWLLAAVKTHAGGLHTPGRL